MRISKTESHRLRIKGLINLEQTATLLCAKRAGESDRSGIISGSENSGFADLSQSQEERTLSSCTRRSHCGNLCAKLGDLEQMGGVFVRLRDDGRDHTGREAKMWGYLPSLHTQNYKSSRRKGKTRKAWPSPRNVS